MPPATRRALTTALSALSVATAADLRARLLADPAARGRAEALHAAERVGEGFELWTDLLSRRAAVMWVLRSVYVRATVDGRRDLCGRGYSPISATAASSIC